MKGPCPEQDTSQLQAADLIDELFVHHIVVQTERSNLLVT
jgi:hypothetical protein